MPHWVRVASAAECPPGSGREVVAGGHIIALFHTETGEFYAIDGICAHQGGPLGSGCLEHHTVTCPWHGWQYDATTGRHRLSEITQRRFAVRVEADDVLVDVGEAG